MWRVPNACIQKLLDAVANHDAERAKWMKARRDAYADIENPAWREEARRRDAEAAAKE
jgi:hypothetical protein